MKNKNDENWINKNKDKHIKWMLTVADRMMLIYPNCSIGVSGSIALGKHTKNSDVDLLVLDKSFKKNVQCVFFKERTIETNILCLNPELLKDRFFSWSKVFNGQQITYIYLTKVIYDPHGYLENIKNKNFEVINIVKTSNKKLAESSEKELIDAIKIPTLNIDYPSFLSYKIYLIKLLVSLWFIRQRIKNLKKEMDKSSFETIKKNDMEFYNLLERALKNDSNLLKHIIELSNLIVR